MCPGQVLFAFLTLLVLAMFFVASKGIQSMDVARKQGMLWMRVLLVWPLID